MKLKDYSFNTIYASGYTGVSIRINNDTKTLNNYCDVSSCIKELTEHPQAEQIANSEIVSTRNYFSELVIVIDYKEKNYYES